MQKKAPVYNYYCSSQDHRQTSEVPRVRSREGSHARGGADRTGDLVLANVIFHAVPVTLGLELGITRGSLSLSMAGSWRGPCPCPACDADPDCDPCVPESSAHPLPGPARDCLALPGSCWRPQRPAPSSRKPMAGFVCFAFFLLLLILLAFLVLSAKLF